jgi:hypothetical protein
MRLRTGTSSIAAVKVGTGGDVRDGFINVYQRHEVEQ